MLIPFQKCRFLKKNVLNKNLLVCYLTLTETTIIKILENNFVQFLVYVFPPPLKVCYGSLMNIK